MHIVLLNDDHPATRPNSVSTMVGGLADAYHKAGHTVTLVTAHDAGENPDVKRGDGAISIPTTTSARYRHWQVVFSRAPARLLRKELARIRPDAVHAHNVHMRLGYAALDAAKACGARVVLTLHDVMSVSEGRINTERYLDSGGQNARLSLSDHWNIAGMRWNPIRNALIRATLHRSTDAITAVSGALAKAMAANGIAGVRTVHNAIDLEAWDAILTDRRLFRMAHGIADDRRVIFFGGRLDKDKGGVPLYRAMRTLEASTPEALLLVAGEERLHADISHVAGTDDLPNILCVGWLDRTGLKAAYDAADIVATPSLCLDAFNLMNLEAMASAKPVVGTIFGGTPEVVEDDVTGYVRDPRTQAYVQALERLISDRSVASRLGEAGRKRAETLFTTQKMVSAYLNLLSGKS